MNLSELFGGREPKVDKYGGENPLYIVDGREQQVEGPIEINLKEHESVNPEEIPVVRPEQIQTYQGLVNLALGRFPGRDRLSFHQLPETIPQTDIVGIEDHALKNIPQGESILFIDKEKEDPEKEDSEEIPTVTIATVIDKRIVSFRTLARVDTELISPGLQTSE